MAQENNLENYTSEFIKIALSVPLFTVNRKDSHTYFIVPFPLDIYRSIVLQRSLNGKKPLKMLNDAGCGSLPVITLSAYRYFLRLRKNYFEIK